MKVHAFVKHRKVLRKARGFSCKEIEESGLSCKEFDALHLQWDSRRGNSYKENVATLKKLEKPQLKAAKPKVAAQKKPVKTEQKK